MNVQNPERIVVRGFAHNMRKLCWTIEVPAKFFAVLRRGSFAQGIVTDREQMTRG